MDDVVSAVQKKRMCKKWCAWDLVPASRVGKDDVGKNIVC